MGTNNMTDTVNLRLLACELRRKEIRRVPEDDALRELARKLGISEWTENMIMRDSSTFASMLEFHMTDIE